ncbi:Hypothetical predicted protein [Pelobates cultripes]|uniref:Uncharacterized protein n=1 Tax=Pelobates cultripes TaxID=61616 RepID=A0AAD1RBR6_PELCU|nr:Hypothetical predicted protein [Pelobates cultripes]
MRPPLPDTQTEGKLQCPRQPKTDPEDRESEQNGVLKPPLPTSCRQQQTSQVQRDTRPEAGTVSNEAHNGGNTEPDQQRHTNNKRGASRAQTADETKQHRGSQTGMQNTSGGSWLTDDTDETSSPHVPLSLSLYL